MLSLKEVSKVYKSGETRVTAAEKVNLSIDKGDFIAIVGPSGSGKTTLLNLIAGLITPDEGDIFFKQKNLKDFSVSDRTDHRLHHMGFVFQDYQLLPILTVYENIEFPLRLKSLGDDHIDESVKWALENVGLKGYGDRFPSQLSGGQQQRVSIARAIADKPSLILADEPTANLDSKTAHEIIELFKSLNTKFDLTFLFSTHDQRLIDQVKKTIYIKDGQIEDES